MPDPLAEAAAQLQWWLRLPPANLIERGDHVRFRHAIYLIIHQTATVLRGMNRLPCTMYFPSRLAGARVQLCGLARGPNQAGSAVRTLATERNQPKAWSIAAQLMADVLAYLPVDSSKYQDPVEGECMPVREQTPEAMTGTAVMLAQRLQALDGVDSVALGGSIARGYADHRSDIDLLVFGRGIPKASDRYQLIGKWPEVEQGPLIESACDSVLADGSMVHVRYWTSAAVDAMLADFPAPPEHFILAEEVQGCGVLVDPAGRLQGWKGVLERMPPDLMVNIIAKSRQRRPSFRDQWARACAANDRIHQYCLANQSVHDFLIALYIRNGRFLSLPRWVHRDFSSFEILPANLNKYLPVMVDGILEDEDVSVRWAMLERMWEELLSSLPRR